MTPPLRLHGELRSVVASGAIVLALAAGVLAVGLAAPVQRIVSDALLRVAAAHPPAPAPGLPDVAVVSLDAWSLRVHPEWPWPRELYARAIEQLDRAGATAIGFDIDFSTRRDPAGDAALADAIARSGRVVLAAFRQVRELPGGGSLEVANVPIPELASAAAGVGSVLMPMDPDGVVRRARRGSVIAGETHASLATEVLDVAARRSGAASADPAGAPAASHREEERRRSGNFAVDYRRSLPAIPELPIADVIEGRFDASDVRGRVVLIGATAAEFQDLWSTPMGPARPGVWIQAVVARTLAAERSDASVLVVAPAWAVWLASLLGVGLLSPFARLDGRRRLLPLAALALTGLAGSLALLVAQGLLLDPTLPLASLALQHLLCLEGVRARLSRQVAEDERSLVALSRVGVSTADAPTCDADPLSIALALLGDVVDARAVALLRADGREGLGERRIDWLRHPGASPAGDPSVAVRALLARETLCCDARGGGQAVYAPLFAGGVPVGVLVVERDGDAPLAPNQHRTIATVGTQIALSAENLRLIEGLRATFDSAVEAIASAVEARDGYTESHCRRLAVFSVLMAERLGLPPDEVEAIRLGALLHDVGKIGIRDEVLLKPGRFDAEERAEMQRHAVLGHRIVAPIHGLTETTVACVRHHHERWDGRGYPDGLAGEEIPLCARIVALVDVWDALSTDRPYKRAYPQEKVLELLRKGRGSSFDPSLVDLFLRVLDEEGEDMLRLTRVGSDG